MVIVDFEPAIKNKDIFSETKINVNLENCLHIV